MVKTNQSELLGGEYPRFVACVVNDKQLVASAAVVLLQYYTRVWSCDYPQSIAAVSISIAATAAAEVIALAADTAAMVVRAAVLSPHYTDDLVLENN